MISSSKVCSQNEKINASVYFIHVVKHYVIVSPETRTEVTDIIIFILFFIAVTAFTLTTTLILVNSWIEKIFITLISFNSMSSICKFLTYFL